VGVALGVAFRGRYVVLPHDGNMGQQMLFVKRFYGIFTVGVR
jgi:hypothetical protein